MWESTALFAGLTEQQYLKPVMKPIIISVGTEMNSITYFNLDYASVSM